MPSGSGAELAAPLVQTTENSLCLFITGLSGQANLHPGCHLRQFSEVPMACRFRDMHGMPGCPGLFTALSWPRRVPSWPSLYTWEPPRSPASSLPPPSSFSCSLRCSHGSGLRPPLSARRPGLRCSLPTGCLRTGCSGRAGRSAPGNQLWLHRRSWQGCRPFFCLHPFHSSLNWSNLW